jgi:hypothetical protein
MSFFKALLIWLSRLIFGARALPAKAQAKALSASNEAVVYFADDPVLTKQKDDFLAGAKRPDWNEEDVYSAKIYAQELFDSRALVDLDSLPAHYFNLIDDANLLESKASVDRLAKKLADEIARRGV